VGSEASRAVGLYVSADRRPDTFLPSFRASDNLGDGRNLCREARNNRLTVCLSYFRIRRQRPGRGRNGKPDPIGDRDDEGKTVAPSTSRLI
jgi:hypothetical protein